MATALAWLNWCEQDMEAAKQSVNVSNRQLQTFKPNLHVAVAAEDEIKHSLGLSRAALTSAKQKRDSAL